MMLLDGLVPENSSSRLTPIAIAERSGSPDPGQRYITAAGRDELADAEQPLFRFVEPDWLHWMSNAILRADSERRGDGVGRPDATSIMLAILRILVKRNMLPPAFGRYRM
jgi:hypothetical protein